MNYIVEAYYQPAGTLSQRRGTTKRTTDLTTAIDTAMDLSTNAQYLCAIVVSTWYGTRSLVGTAKHGTYTPAGADDNG